MRKLKRSELVQKNWRVRTPHGWFMQRRFAFPEEARKWAEGIHSKPWSELAGEGYSVCWGLPGRGGR